MRIDKLKNVLKHPQTHYQVTKAKKVYRKKHPRCELTGYKRDPVTGKNNDVHHIVPCHARPDLATDPNNLVTLTRLAHFWVGHLGNWKTWNSAIASAIVALRKALNATAKRCRKLADGRTEIEE